MLNGGLSRLYQLTHVGTVKTIRQLFTWFLVESKGTDPFLSYTNRGRDRNEMLPCVMKHKWLPFVVTAKNPAVP
jgi:hypothetical protein